MDIHKIKLQFAQHLPYGHVSKIQKRLTDKGIEFTRQYITSVCNPAKPQFEADIINEAIELANEHKSKLESLAIKAQGLNTPNQVEA